MPEEFHEEVEYLPSQEKALSYMIWDDELLAVYMYGGVRGGKSFLACKVAQAIAQLYPGSEVLICRDTRVNIKQTTQKTFFDIDSNGAPVTCRALYSMRNWNETMGELTWNNGSRTCFWGLDTTEHIDRVKSTQWSAIIVEEANGVRFDIIEFLLFTRLSHPLGPGKMLLISNTDKGEDHLFKMFFHEHTCGKERACAMCVGLCQMRRVHVSTLDNEKNLPQKYIKNIKTMAANRQEYARIYVHGEHVVVEGLIYPMYEERYNVVDFPAGYEWGAAVETVYGYDHGFGGSPSCLLECKVLSDGTLVFWQETYFERKEKQWTVRSMAQEMLRMGIKHVHCADPSIQNKNQDDGGRVTSIQQLFMENGVQMELADNDVDGRIERTRDLMSADPEHVCLIPGVAQEGLKGIPRFLIARVSARIRCPNLHSQIMQRVNKKDAKGRVAGKKFSPEEGNDHALDPCHVKGTEIRTLQGSKKIEEMCVGDEVVTPFGPSKVLWAGKTGIQRETLLASFSGNEKLQTTPNHKFFVLGKGLVPLEDLMLGDILFSCKYLQSPTRECGTILMDGIIRQLGDAKMAGRGFMWLFGKKCMVPFRRATTYITKIRIELIGVWRIWKFLMHSRIFPPMRGLFGAIKNGPKKDVNILRQSEERRGNGMHQGKENNGTGNRQQPYMPKESPKNITARDVKKSSLPSTLQQLNTVLQNAGRRTEGSWGRTIRKWFAKVVGKSFSPIDTSSGDTVFLVSLSRAGREDVYNIQTEHGLYYANGILTKNCEYIVNARYRGKLAIKPEPEQGTAAWVHQKAMQKFFAERQEGLQPISGRL